MGDKYINEPTASSEIKTDNVTSARRIKTAPEVSPELLKKIAADDSTKPQATVKPVAAAGAPSDQTIDKAIEDIVANEGDTVLLAEDQIVKKAPKPVIKSSKIKRFFKNKWLWLGLATILVATFAIPVSRYAVLGLVIKHDVIIKVKDSQTSSPVSNASVTLHGTTAKTNAYGEATIKAPVGSTKLSVSKQYFKSYSTNFMVGYTSSQSTSISLTATGRQVPITVVDIITNKPLAGAKITILDTTASTDQSGKATIVLPTTNATTKATVTLAGYNTTDFNVEVTDKVSVTNNLHLTPAGRIYFLSNASGKIDVIKTNLDGSDRQTVLAGTGNEDPNSTSLLASRDWRFLVLKAQRDTAQPALYLIDTASDQVTNFDSGNADFNLIGWNGHNFIYDVTRATVLAYQTGHETLKSYNADNAQLNLLDQNLAEGTATNYAYQGFYNFNMLNGQVVYNTQWYTHGSGVDLSGKTDTIRGIMLSTQTKKDYQTIAATGLQYILSVLYQPQGIYYAFYTSANGVTSPTYYAFDGQTATVNTSLDQSVFNRSYSSYILSPTGNKLLWAELRNSKNGLYVGDQNAAGAKLLDGAGDYLPYGWFSDNYLVVSKNGNELYIMPATGLASASQPPVKISDYYRSVQSYSGYSYGGQ